LGPQSFLESVAALEKEIPEICHVIRKMNGSSKAVLVGASDGKLYVAKFQESREHSNALFNEIAGYKVYRLFGLPVPGWTFLSISSWMIDSNADCLGFSRDERATPHSGICFGSRFIACPPRRVYEILPSCMFPRIRNREYFWLSWLIDVLARHNYHRQALFVDDPDGQLSTVFIDHSHLFGGHDGSKIPSHSQAQYVDPRIYMSPNTGMKTRLCERLQRFDSDAVWQKLTFLPDEWKTPSALQSLRECLDRLSNSALAWSICEELIDSVLIPSRGNTVKFTVPEHLMETINVAAFTD